MKQSETDVIVIGGGHAGLEAALAASRMGAAVTLVTLDPAKIGEMSCNPAVGGLGKGHLVREVDALGGALGRIADAAGIQFRLLNRRKGPAVRGPRAQCDRDLFRRAAQDFVGRTEKLSVISGEVVGLILRNGLAVGVSLSDETKLWSRSIVLTTGTFLGGLVHVGAQSWPAGRMGEEAASRLSEQLRQASLPLGRLKTGTPPRLAAETIDWDALAPQPGDEEPVFLSFATKRPAAQQISCYIAHTNPAVHAEISANLSRSAMHAGAITGPGPRYCPSIEDKVTRFAEKESHQIFLEPEGLTSSLIYPNGISTSLPMDVQERFVRQIKGLQRAEIRQPGYAIEYDYVDPRSLDRRLAHREISGLFLAGQINGTTGYEEAAAQGLIAGANAAAVALEEPFVEVDRATGYVGVMIDDLVSMGVSEPYRMFTSRAEYRLQLRIDNADQRLTPIGIEHGLIGASQRLAFVEKQEALAGGRSALSDVSLTPAEAEARGILVRADGVRRDGMALLAMPETSFEELESLSPMLADVSPDIRELLEIEAQYQVYLDRQANDIARLRMEESRRLPPDLEFGSIAGLSSELQAKLSEVRPETMAQARRIEGMTPAALLLLLAAGEASRRRSANG
ncbi:MAG: tRNA uridine-5-carboxymethylaminomethyl(34) synthesis enzyme MnmG [Pseudomonadota bacterium]